MKSDFSVTEKMDLEPLLYVSPFTFPWKKPVDH